MESGRASRRNDRHATDGALRGPGPARGREEDIETFDGYKSSFVGKTKKFLENDTVKTIATVAGGIFALEKSKGLYESATAKEERLDQLRTEISENKRKKEKIQRKIDDAPSSLKYRMKYHNAQEEGMRLKKEKRNLEEKPIDWLSVAGATAGAVLGMHGLADKVVRKYDDKAKSPAEPASRATRASIAPPRRRDPGGDGHGHASLPPSPEAGWWEGPDRSDREAEAGAFRTSPRRDREALMSGAISGPDPMDSDGKSEIGIHCVPSPAVERPDRRADAGPGWRYPGMAAASAGMYEGILRHRRQGRPVRPALTRPPAPSRNAPTDRA